MVRFVRSDGLELEPSQGLSVGTQDHADLKRRTVMIDRSDLIRQANELRERAELETDERSRNRLMRMADHYAHLAESKAQSEAHPPSASSLGEIFAKGD